MAIILQGYYLDEEGHAWGKIYTEKTREPKGSKKLPKAEAGGKEGEQYGLGDARDPSCPVTGVSLGDSRCVKHARDAEGYL